MIDAAVLISEVLKLPRNNELYYQGPGEGGNTDRHDQKYDSPTGTHQKTGEQILSQA